MGLGIEGNGLVARVKAGHVAFSTVDAKIVVDHRELLLFGHVVDILEVVVACSSDVLESGDLGKLDFGWLLAFGPEMEVVDVFLELLTGLNRRTLTFPSFFL